MEAAKAFFLEQCARYPKLHPQDLLKALHQSIFGCGHFITDEDAGFKLKEIIMKEQHNCRATGYCKTNSIKYNFLLLAHEYLFIFEKGAK